jgi:ribosomal protein L12E/L44/L45/RPP1/RPP2
MKTMKLGLRFESDGGHGLSFRLISSSDLKGYTGSYRLMDAADGQGTVVITEMDLDAGAMVPRFMVDRMAKKSIDDTGAALREYVKKLPPPGAAPAAAAAPAAKQAAPAAKRRRARRILRVTKTGQGLRIWYMGREIEVKA